MAEVRADRTALLLAGYDSGSARCELSRHLADRESLVEESGHILGGEIPKLTPLLRFQRTWNVGQETLRLYLPGQ